MMQLLHAVVLVVLVACACITVHGYRILESLDQLSDASHAVFEPYERGHVGYFGDPRNPSPERVNEGAPFSPDTPRIYLYASPKQNCPGMIGPIRDEEYYCHGREYGYCDRRNGVCVCNQGYTGIDCQECTSSYFKQGNLCYPKKSCPNDCSRGGTCDYATGKCECFVYRKGDDCAQPVCHFDPLCTSCTATKCLSCVEGFFVDDSVNKCQSCKQFDPRCLVCNRDGCLACADPLLNSVRRSGARYRLDASLPLDELTREFSFQFSYGSQDPRVFDEAEVYSIVSTLQNPLNASTQACVQGVRQDAAWVCERTVTSHVVCGHKGVFTFSSPVYAVAENARNLTVTVTRSGGGYGFVSIDYDLEYLNATASDVSPTAYYTSSQTLDFAPGVISKSFLLTIHDDGIPDADKMFRVVLQPPLDGATSLGNQRSALVTIVDDDQVTIDASTTYVMDTKTLVLGGSAGATLTFKIQAVLGNGQVKRIGKDLLYMESYEEQATVSYRPSNSITDHQNGTYTCSWMRTEAGMYTVAVYSLLSGGLRGEYYADAWFTGAPLVSRIDAHVNFTWNDGPLIPGARDFVAVRWSGRLRPKVNGDTTIYVQADDHVRVWIDQILVVDQWDTETDRQEATAVVSLSSAKYHAITIEYRDLAGDAFIRLSWSSASVAKEIIPSANLLSELHIQGSPFRQIPITPAKQLSASQSILQGDLVTVAGAAWSMTLFPLDSYGNPMDVNQLTVKNDLVSARLVLTDDQSRGAVVTTKTLDALVAVDYENQAIQLMTTPLISGKYEFTPSLSGVKVMGSPFVVQVQPGPFHPTRSLLSGPGLSAKRIAGVSTTVVLEARDYYGNRILRGGYATFLRVRAVHATASPPSIEVGRVQTDHGDGTYTLTYTPRLSGTYNVRITFNDLDLHVHNSPYSVTVVPNVVAGDTSSAAGAGLTTASTNVQATFTITMRDLNGNLITQGGSTVFTNKAVFQVVLVHPTRGNVTGSCTDLSNGQLSCTYTPKFVGLSQLHVGLARTSEPLRPIQSSPFTIDVVAGPPIAGRSIAQGQALATSVAGLRTNFTVTVRDAFDNDKTNAGNGQETIRVVFTGPAPSTAVVPSSSINAQVTYTKDGIYVVSYRLTTAGSYKLQVQVNNADIAGSPFSMVTLPAIANATTTSIDLVSTTPFYAGQSIVTRITTRDAFGNALVSGNYQFLFPGIEHTIESWSDDQNGQYTLSFRPLVAETVVWTPKLVLFGGWNATYYATADLSKLHVVTRRIDPVIDMDFDAKPPPQTDTMRVYSIRWQAYVRPAYSELYTFEIQSGGGGGYQLLVNNQSLVDASYWPSARHQVYRTSPIALVANELTFVQFQYAKASAATSHGSIRLLWEAFSQPKQLLPSDHVGTSWRILNNVPSLAIQPHDATPTAFTTEFTHPATWAKVEASNTVVYGTAGKPVVFYVIARDAQRNRRRVGGDLIHLLLPQLDGTPGALSPVIQDQTNGSYRVSFSPITSGTFSMTIAATATSFTMSPSLQMRSRIDLLRPFNIQNSPFVLQIAPNDALASTSTLSGLGVSQATAGVTASLVVQPRDLHSNPYKTSLTSLFKIEFRHIATGVVVIPSRIRDVGDGTYQVDYIATMTGNHGIYLQMPTDAAFAVKTTTLRVYPNVASALTSTVSGSGISTATKAANVAQFYTVQLNDAYRNPLETGGNDLGVWIYGVSSIGTIVRGTITDLMNGQYQVRYVLPVAGVYAIETHVATPGLNGLMGYYFDSLRYVGTMHAMVKRRDPTISLSHVDNVYLYVRIQWRGFLKPVYTDVYTLEFQRDGGGAIALAIDDTVVIDTINRPASALSASIGLVQNRLHKIAIEYQHPYSTDAASLEFYWRSAQQTKEIVPTTALIAETQEIVPGPQITIV